MQGLGALGVRVLGVRVLVVRGQGGQLRRFPDPGYQHEYFTQLGSCSCDA
ncbi:hypothetical protein GCM10027405_16090 [Arthrobacter alkaliphilus]